MKRISQIILSVIIWSFLINVQAQTYQLTVSNKPFIFLENPEVAVQGTWDLPVFQVPLGFDFEFFDITSNQLYSAANSFGGYTSLNHDEEHLYMLIHFYASMIDRGYQQDSAASPIYYKTEGPVGQSVFTLEYNNVGLFFGLQDEYGVFLDYINLQVKLYESSGDIEFHIGPYSILEDPGSVFAGYPGPFIGLFSDADNTPGGDIGEVILLAGDPLNPTVVTDPFSTVNWPIPENTVYKFSRKGTFVGDGILAARKPLFFPNPTYGDINLNENFASDLIYPIIVIDVLGKTIDQWNTESEISASSLPSGSYYTIVHTKNKVVTEKLIILPN